MPIEIHFVFLTTRWRNREHDFDRALQRLSVPLNERVWVGIGETQNEPWLRVTVKRERRVSTISGWKVSIDENNHTYEKVYEGPDPSPQQVSSDIQALLAIQQE